MNVRRAGFGLGVIGLVATLVVTLVPPAWSARPGGKSGVQGSESILTIDNQRRIDVNQINMWVTNFGSFAYDLTTGNSGLIYPKGTTKTAVFASGLWLGATVLGQTRTVVAEYSQEYGPGAMVGVTFDDPSKPEYIVYKVVRFTGDPTDTAHVDRDAEELASDPGLDPIVHHSWSEYVNGATPFGAPTRTYRLPVTTTPDPSDSVDVLGPDVLGDQMLWTVYNDADPDRHTNDAGSSPPFGVEIQQTTFGFNRPGPLGNTVFLQFKIINKGGNQLDNMFVSLWSDPDLGGFTDDLVGVDTDLSLGYVYNSTNADQQYGGAPPAVGYDFFLGPIDEATGDTLFLKSFNKYINGTDPTSTEETYNYMQGLLPDGSFLIDPTTGEVTNFFHPGDPILGTGWLDANPADRRFLLNAGPFSMAPSDTQLIVGAIIVGQGNDRLSSIAALKFFDRFAQIAFDEGFQLPSPPPQPKVDVDVDQNRITLCWDPAPILNYNEPGYKFEGFNVYQGASVAGPWVRIATFDSINTIRLIRDEVFDIETGQTISDFPVAFGSDAGIQFCHTISQDAVRGGSLKEGTEYFFAVTAYSYGANEPVGLKVLENAQQVIRVIPQSPAAGTDPATASVDVQYMQIDDTKPPATDVIDVRVVNPDEVTGHTYKVGFAPIVPPLETIVGSDTATVLNSWFLYDVTTGDTLFSGQINRRGDEAYRVVDGIQVRVIGKYFPQLQDANYRNDNTDHRRALGGVNFGLEFFGGGAGYAATFTGSSLDPSTEPDSFTTVELRFGVTQKAYRYFRDELADSSRVGGGVYRYGGYQDVPFQAWDTINNVQLDAAFVERRCVTDATSTVMCPVQPGTHDSTWAPTAFSDDPDAGGAAATLGGREYAYALNTPYTATPKSVWTQDGFLVDPGAPILYALTASYRTADDVIDPGDRFEYVYANPATPNDMYVFSTSQLVRGNSMLAAGRLDRIRVVPNPYYNRSTYEISQFNRIVRFINMPETATVRIFNLAGDLVRTLQKTNPTNSVLDWDLQTNNDLPVGSGIYIFHVDAGQAGSTFGRLVVFMEKERLNNF